jgi:hypothetical protein
MPASVGSGFGRSYPTITNPGPIADLGGEPGQGAPERRSGARLLHCALGRSNVCGLQKGPVEPPSDFLGVVTLAMDESGGWRHALAKELRHAGLPVDANKLA